MKYSEISNLQIQELRKRLSQIKQSLFDAKMKQKMQRLSNMMEIRHNRKDIARLQTAITSFVKKAIVSGTTTKTVIAKKVETKKAVVAKKVETKKVVIAKKVETKKAVVAKKVETKKTVVAKKVETKKAGIKKLQKPDDHKGNKKWFSFLGTKKSSPQSKSGKKKQFFNRKTGG